ncbi:hypothetical protein [Tissierella praeacuta]|uniref:hypothetical protein n=1 Tax=Tissierella praeacuta TaxID=43131 RepID=UPI0033429871
MFNYNNYDHSSGHWESSGFKKSNDDVMTVGEWIGVLIVLAIPILNILMYFVWGFSENTNKNLQNFSRATLIIGAILIGFGVLFGGCTSFYR